MNHLHLHPIWWRLRLIFKIVQPTSLAEMRLLSANSYHFSRSGDIDNNLFHEGAVLSDSGHVFTFIDTATHPHLHRRLRTTG